MHPDSHEMTHESHNVLTSKGDIRCEWENKKATIFKKNLNETL